MKTLLLFVLCTLALTSLPLEEVKAQDPIDQYDGIPLIIYPAKRSVEMIYPLNFEQMDSLGLFGVVAPDVINLSDPQYLEHYEEFNLKMIPQQVWWAPNDIFRYTDAYYTVWEAEGTDPLKGMVTLYHSEHTTLSPDGKSIIAEGPNVPVGETIIFGPGYPQVSEYKYDIDNIGSTINYTAGFNMKITQRGPLPTGYENDVVCTVEVTNNNDPLNHNTESTINSIEVKVKDFLPPLGNGWNSWKEINLGYNLLNNVLSNRIDQINVGQDIALCVQFKVIWAGLDYLDLYVDKIGVYDNKGFSLATDTTFQNLIVQQVTPYLNNDAIIGWYALDEPESIDNYECFRIVDSLIQSVEGSNVRLHTGFTGGRRGKFSSWLDIDTMALGKFQDQEFWLRTKPKNLQINMYNYYYPYVPWVGNPRYHADWKTLDIEYVTEYLDRINDFDTNFAFSTQAGGYYTIDENCNIREDLIIPTPTQINYHANLGLMYGAKELRLDPFFSHEVYDSNCETFYFNTKGLIDENENTTLNYNFFKNTIIPRLNGSFGKELKKIHQVVQHPNLQLPITQPINNNYDWLTSITYLNGDGSSGADFIDVGFFETHFESNDVPYFMVVNRWYNTAGQGGLLKINIDKTGTGYTNYNVTNFIENTKQTIVNSGFVTMPHIPGEARLFKVYPVLKDGGSLTVSETTHPNDILLGDMSIENGVTLTVNGTYYAKAIITVKSGGKIVAGTNGKIIFDPNKYLIIDGNAQVNGTSNNRLTLDFNSNTAAGVEVRFYNALTMSYCNINNAHVGINAENASNISISNINFTNCQGSGIVLFSFGNGDSNLPSSTSQYLTAL